MTKHGKPQHCVILVRHAKREVCWDTSEDQHQMAGWSEDHNPGSKSNFRKDGVDLTYALAGRLCDQLLADKMAVKKIIHGQHLVTKSFRQ